MVKRVFVCVGVAAMSCVMMFGQTFEMADVHVSPHSDNPSLCILHRDGKYELLGASMVDLVSTAYGVKPDAVTGGPGWLESDRVDVIAKAPNDLPNEALQAMLQTLLAGISLFDAVDKQLGLNLAMGKAPLPVLVVDRVNEKSTANLPGVTEKLPELRLEFDVADIKPSTQDHPTAPRFTPGGRLEVRGVTLIALIQHVWGLDTYDNELISGGPKWLTTERFDIVAKATPPDGPSSALKDDDVLRAMLRNMLTDRFGLAVHSEEKQVSVYALTADKPKLKQADPSVRSKCSEGAAVTAALAGVLPQRTITCTNTSTAELADRLHQLGTGYINRPVVDATEIDGVWDFSLLYSWPGVVNAGPPADGQPGAADPTGAITLFEALQKQLGLRLATEKRAMPVLVIDHVEPNPSDN